MQIDNKPLLWWMGKKVRWSPFGQRVIGQVVTNPLFFAMLAIVLTLEMVIPAKQTQLLFSVSFFADMLYYLTDGAGRFICSVLLAATATLGLRSHAWVSYD